MIDFFSLPQEKKERVTKMFWDRVDKGNGDGCWLWTGAKAKEGYGYIQTFRSVGGRWVVDFKILSHRLAWMLNYNSKIPEGLFCLHSCDTPSCVKPTHIALGTLHQNQADSRLKDRRTKVKLGERFKIAETIYKGMPVSKVAKMYKISCSIIYDYLKRKEIVDRYGKIDLGYRKHQGRVSMFPPLI